MCIQRQRAIYWMTVYMFLLWFVPTRASLFHWQKKTSLIRIDSEMMGHKWCENWISVCFPPEVEHKRAGKYNYKGHSFHSGLLGHRVGTKAPRHAVVRLWIGLLKHIDYGSQNRHASLRMQAPLAGNFFPSIGWWNSHGICKFAPLSSIALGPNKTRWRCHLRS